MPMPQVPERVKEAPAIALRAVFAGIGQLLLAAEKARARVMEQVSHPTSAEPPGPAEPTAPIPRQAPRRPLDETGNVRVIPDGPAEVDHAAGRAVPDRSEPEPEPAAAAPAAQPPAEPAAPAAGPAAPIANYDELSIASLRARLRVLDAATLRDLIDYELAHAGRSDVVAMFERRLAKVEGAAG